MIKKIPIIDVNTGKVIKSMKESKKIKSQKLTKVKKKEMAKTIVDAISTYSWYGYGSHFIDDLMDITWGIRACWTIQENGIYSGDSGMTVSWAQERKYLMDLDDEALHKAYELAKKWIQEYDSDSD